MKVHQRLTAVAEALESHGRPKAAEDARRMARDALTMETYFGAENNLYAHWASELEEWVQQITEGPGVAPITPPGARPEPQEWR